MSSYVVTGPMVIAKCADGRLIYVYRDGELPADVPAEEADRLVATGLVENVGGREPAGDADEPKRPASTATKAVWVEYAVTQGMDAAEADKLTRDQLAARFAKA